MSLFEIVTAWFKPLLKDQLHLATGAVTGCWRLTFRLHGSNYPRALKENQVEIGTIRTPKTL